MRKKMAIVGGLCLPLGIVLFLAFDWPFAWVGVGLIVTGVLGLIGSIERSGIQGGPMKTGFVASKTAMFKGRTVPVARLLNNAKTLEFIGFLPTDGMVIKDTWNNLGWEVQSDPTEIILNGVSQGMGYIVDESGITISLKRDIRFYPVEVRPDGEEAKSKPLDVWKPPEVSIFAKFEGVIGNLTTRSVLADSIGMEPSGRTLLINRILFLFIGWFLIGTISHAVFHFP